MVVNIVGLDFCIPELIWTVVTFFVLMFLLKKFLYNPVLKILDERKAGVESGIAEGKKAESDFKETNAALNDELIEQNNRARELIGQAKTDAENEKKATLSEAQKEAETIRNDIRVQIDAEEASAKSEVDDNMSDFVELLTKKLLNSEDEDCSPELIESCVNEAKDN